MAKRFRKVYIICENNSIFSNLEQITVFKYRDHAEYRLKYLEKQAREGQHKSFNEHQPLPKYKVYGFYLVLEDMFQD